MKTPLLVILDCGHPPTETVILGMGYAVLPDESKICYVCADARQREELKDRTHPCYAYVSGDGTKITTWTGGDLMRVTVARPCKLTRASWTHDQRSYHSIRAVDCHGKEWYGRGSAGICITLRACK